MTEKAYVTLVATDIYAAGALVLAHRLRDMGSTYDLVCLVTTDISTTVLEHLSQLYKVVCVDTLTSTDDDNLALLGRPELNITFTKLHLWNLTDYDKLVFLDADTLPLRNIDDLFDRPNFSAAPDAGWPDCFNSGVFVTEPSEKDYHDLKKMATEQGSFDGGDQGLLNTYFKSWSSSSSAHRLPFTYNTTPTSQYSYAPAHQYYANNIAICHFIGLDKPWKYQRFADGNVFSQGWKGLTDMVQSWWDTWNLYYGQNQPHLLLSRSPTDTLVHSHSTRPIKLFSEPLANAWDTPDICDNINLYQQHRQTDSMPPIANITISTPNWASQHVDTTHPYPVSSDSHRIADTYFDDASQYSSVDGIDSTGDHGSDAANEIDIHHDQHIPIDDNSHDTVYHTIDWNPAYESPPNTGVAANIPDLSSFVNAWDQPFQGQPVWIAPEPQPIPKMDHDYGFVHETQHHHETNHHQPQLDHHSSDSQLHYQNVFPWEQTVQHVPDPTRIWLDDQTQMTPADTFDKRGPYNGTEQKEDPLQHHHDDGAHASRSRDLAPPVQQVEQHGHHTNDTLETQRISNEHEHYTEQEDPQTPSYAMDLMIPLSKSPGRSPRTSMYFGTFDDDSNQQTEYDWSDRDLIPIPLKRSSKLNIEGLSPSLPQSPIGSRRGSISKSRRSSISSVGRSNRIRTAPGSPSGSITPIKARGTQIDYSLFSRQPVSLFAQENVTYSTKKTPYTSAATTPIREKGSFLCDTDEQQYEHQVASTCEEDSINHYDDFLLDYSFDASVTNRQYQQHLSSNQPEWDPREALERLRDTSETIMRSYGQQQQQEQQPATEPFLEVDEPTQGDHRYDPVIDTKTTSDAHYALDDITLPSFPQEDLGRPFYSSGSSSPRTPTVRGLDSNLTVEIEAVREQHRQHQRTALSLLQPHTAVATLLEAELDLSKSSLYNRRHDHNANNSQLDTRSADFVSGEPSTYAMNTASTGGVSYYSGTHTPTDMGYSSTMGFYQGSQPNDKDDDDNDENDTQNPSTYFDFSVVETARRKLNALTQNVSVTSMSSTTTVNEDYDEDTEESASGATLQDLSRYSFPPVLYDYGSYHFEPTMHATTLEEHYHDPQELTSSSTLHERSQLVDHHSEETMTVQLFDDGDGDGDGYDMVSGGETYEQITISLDDDDGGSISIGDAYDRVSISIDDDETTSTSAAGHSYDRITILADDDSGDETPTSNTYERVLISVDDDDYDWGDQRINDNDQAIATWLTLTSNSMTTQEDDGDRGSSTMERIISQDSSNSSGGNSVDIITSTIDCITETDDEESSPIEKETKHTHHIVEANESTDDGVDTFETDPAAPTFSITATTPTTMTAPVSLPTTSALSTSAVSTISSLRTISRTSMSDDDSDAAFLSAVDGTLSPGGSSSLCSSTDWHTVHSSTPTPDANGSDDDDDDDSDHEASALSLLEIDTNDLAEEASGEEDIKQRLGAGPSSVNVHMEFSNELSDSGSVTSERTATGIV